MAFSSAVLTAASASGWALSQALAFLVPPNGWGLCPKGAANAVRNPAHGRSLGLLLSGDALRNMWLRLYT